MARHIPDKVNVNEPSPARVYDYFLGGKDNFAVDRQHAMEYLSRWPDLVENARQNRAWMVRVVEYLASQGVDQFLDIGSGLPTAPNVHQVAQRSIPDARVVYVDNDPIVLAHGRAILGGGSHTHYIQADVRDPEPILDEAAEHLDMARPIGVLLASVLHYVEQEPATLTKPLMRRLAPGSYLAVAHVTDEDSPPEFLERVRQAFKGHFWPRPIPVIRKAFDGLELVDGLTDVQRWRADQPAEIGTQRLIGGVGRKP
ncbi:SAM-dependent methyltransferase [Actinomadura sp. K4S16]|uniref:SAM-dependent methyltransferase n=1 Tax=Actinomadura sp. K4S16 TaxID=1316147 RepID=UPI0011EC221D|nr:SAM-dependent methyltransferase [Actinomadura sp. K4S16]